MLFSFVIPVFNSEKYLRECLKSILNQTYSNFEVVIIDDGSTDSSAQILDEFSQKDYRIKVYHKENSGVAIARQLGVSLAHGDYVIFVDSDDTINLDLLLNVKLAIKQFPDVEMIRFKCKMINDKPEFDHELFNDYNSDYNVIYSGIEAIKRWNNPKKRYEIFWLYAIKKAKAQFIQNTPNFKSSGDYAIVPIMIANCQKVVMIDYVGYNYTCDNKDSITHLSGYEKEKQRTLNFIKAYKYLLLNMREIEQRQNIDMTFFYKEWKQRLQKRYNTITESLRIELKANFEEAFNQ